MGTARRTRNGNARGARDICECELTRAHAHCDDTTCGNGPANADNGNARGSAPPRRRASFYVLRCTLRRQRRAPHRTARPEASTRARVGAPRGPSGRRATARPASRQPLGIYALAGPARLSCVPSGSPSALPPRCATPTRELQETPTANSHSHALFGSERRALGDARRGGAERRDRRDRDRRDRDRRDRRDRPVPQVSPVSPGLARSRRFCSS